MNEPPPRDPREPVDPPEDETVIVPPAEQTVVGDAWEPESEVFVEQTAEAVPVRRRPPLLWPGLLALLVLVLGGLAVGYFLSRDDDEPSATTATTAPTTTSVETLRVPDVVGTTSSEATQTLRDAGFEANVVAVPSDRPSGQVVAQNPPAGEDAPEGSTVRLNVAQEATETTPTTTGATTTAPTTTAPTATTAPPATAPATVPDAVGQELADAARSFADEWLNVSVQYVPSNEAAGRVVAQAQPAGKVLKRGDSVQLNVSTGADPPEEATVPDVVGERLDRGRSALEQAGFEVLALRLGPGEVRREDELVSQTPAARASIPRGSLVLVYVSA